MYLLVCLFTVIGCYIATALCSSSARTISDAQQRHWRLPVKQANNTWSLIQIIWYNTALVLKTGCFFATSVFRNSYSFPSHLLRLWGINQGMLHGCGTGSCAVHIYNEMQASLSSEIPSTYFIAHNIYIYTITFLLYEA